MAVAEVTEAGEEVKKDEGGMDNEPEQDAATEETGEGSEEGGDYSYPEDDEGPAEETGDSSEESAKEEAPVEEGVEEVEEEAVAENATVEEVALDERLIVRAQEAGLNKEQAEAYHKAGLLDGTLEAFDRKLGSLARELRPGQTQESPLPNAGVKPQAEVTVPSGEAEAAFKLDLGENEYDEGLIKNLQNFTDHVNSKFSDLNGKLQAVEQARAAELNREFLGQFDGWVSGLGEEWQDTFGKGSIAELAEGSQEIANRRQLLEQCDDLRNTYTLRGLQPPPQSELQERALRSAFGQKVETIARKQILAKVKKRGKQTISKPSRREGSKLSEVGRAQEFAENFFKERDIPTDELPDEQY